MEKKQLVKAELIRYYYFIDERAKVVQQISDLQYEMGGVKGVSFGDVHGTPMDRQTKLIRLMEQADQLRRLLASYETNQLAIKNELHLESLNADELLILDKYIHQRCTFSQIAQSVGYAHKVVVYRKYNDIIDKLALWLV